MLLNSNPISLSIIFILLRSSTSYSLVKWCNANRFTFLHQQVEVRECEGESQWTMGEDWAIIDQVPRYTVGTSTQSRTFWSQMTLSTADICNRSWFDVRERYQYLREKNNNTLSPSGPSPPILEDWWIDISKSMIGGKLEEGPVVWFSFQSIGRLTDDPISDVSENMCAGGFVEAMGGRVFELGTRSAKKENHDGYVPRYVVGTEEAENKLSSGKLDQSLWMASKTATVSAFFAASVLSAFLGFQASSSLQAASSLQSAQSLRPTRSVVTKSISYGSTQSARQGSQSTSELRARQEVRVFQEKRMIGVIQEKLEKDEIKLQELNQQEKSEILVNTNENKE